MDIAEQLDWYRNVEKYKYTGTVDNIRNFSYSFTLGSDGTISNFHRIQPETRKAQQSSVGEPDSYEECFTGRTRRV